ncbi:flagellin N-terminal helical domain-containing protein [Petrocella sp. FN5]|uniref:flagellin N-terminal helical domain-containing protein n=1 Tax=Petrocella sp. FN5 TaxID=3032002 RepID=UPI0023DB31E5|nr:flagellin [Petrocella sp. FN5]MDF1615992.1 flagellin [Petrocella sp. FN5]
MRINNNLMAMNTHRQLGMGQANGAKSMEKLSSGFRINRAGDDAAGLAISEKMRGQIRGLNQASRNSQDAISLVQTAEGALNETQAILQRMRELAVQSSTDTNVDVDRGALQNEVNELAKEISRISGTTEFNTQKLLDGNFEGTFHIGANEGQNLSLTINAMDANTLGVSGDVYTAIDLVGNTDLEVRSLTGDALAINITVGGDATTAADFAIDTSTEGVIAVTLASAVDSADSITTLNNLMAELNKIGGFEVSVKEGSTVVAGDLAAAGNTTVPTTLDENFEGTINGINISTQEVASSAITTINDALESVSAERSKLGAVQNRLEHTIKNLDTSSENLQASESRIRDVDMAKEMMEFTKNNILTQAAQAMLAQANAAPQGVLQLLR